MLEKNHREEKISVERKGNKEYKKDPVKASMRMTIMYVFLGSLWILMSDRLLGLLDIEKAAATRISIAKGWVFVIVTGILVYTVVYSILLKLRTTEESLYDSCQSLRNTSKELEDAYHKTTESRKELSQYYIKLMENQQKLEKREQELEYQAHHDQITGAPNKKALVKYVNELINSAAGDKTALIIVDIDNFKYINDTRGHSFGDQLLVKVYSHLESLAGRASAVYKLGEDGFVVMLEGFREVSEVKELAVKLLKGFKSPFDIGGIDFYITVSLGISLFPEHGSSADELLKNADIALCKAKETGKNRIVFYNKPMDEEILERVAIEKQLRTALLNDEFELYYQPQLDTATKTVSGFEALIRWNSPILGPVSPLRFISIAEDTHMIIPIGEWVLRNACIYLKKLHQRGYTWLTMAVNISMVQLLQEDFTDMVLETLAWLKLSPACLELEITESTLMESCEVIEEKLSILREKGIKIALDDFGKGYSSLYYLRQLPISTLKIDKSFVETIGSKGKHKTLTSFMVRIGRTMGLDVIAEGVETKEQLDYLIKNKCHKIQGYYFSKPISESEVIEYLEERTEECK